MSPHLILAFLLLLYTGLDITPLYLSLKAGSHWLSKADLVFSNALFFLSLSAIAWQIFRRKNPHFEFVVFGIFLVLFALVKIRHFLAVLT